MFSVAPDKTVVDTAAPDNAALDNAVIVAVSSTTKNYDKEYTYLIPDAFRGDIRAGMLAVAPFGRKNAGRHVIVLDVITVESGNGIKWLSDERQPELMLTAADIELAAFMRRRYNCTWFDAFKCMLPKGWEKKREIKSKDPYRGRVFEKADEFIPTNEQRVVIERILACLTEDRNEDRYEGSYEGVSEGRYEGGFVDRYEGGSEGVSEGVSEGGYEGGSEDRFEDKNDGGSEGGYEGGFREILLHGVTGGGKTEVYMQVIKRVVELGKEAITLVPEISLTPQMVERFKCRFGDNVAVFHSRLSEGERRDQWKRVRDKQVSIVVGARSAVFAPFENIGIIIIDEEHESSYKSEVSPRYHAAEIAKFRCRQSGAALLYGSATPSIERYYSAIAGKTELLTIANRTNNQELPIVSVVDMRDELKHGNRSMFSRELRNEIEKNIQNGEQTMLFLNRRGYSPFVLCRSCGYIMQCRNCSVSYTYHADIRKLMCHYCGVTAYPPDACPVCKSPDIRHFGAGTQRVEEEVKQIFGGCSVIRMDRDTTTAKNSHEKILKEFVEQKIDIMIGTQMIAKGHDFPNVTLVGALAADPLLNINDFRSSERAFQLLTQVSGRAGRGEMEGRVIIQTYNPDHYSVMTAQNHDYRGFYKQEILLRKELGYPPFKSIGVVIVSGKNDRNVYDAIYALFTRLCETQKATAANTANTVAATTVANTVNTVVATTVANTANTVAATTVVNTANTRAQSPCVQVAHCDGTREPSPCVPASRGDDELIITKPVRPPIGVIKDKYRWRFIIKHKDVMKLADILGDLSSFFHAGKLPQQTELSVDINPFSMM